MIKSEGKEVLKMVEKYYTTVCPIEGKKANVKVSFDKIEVCGDTNTHFLKYGYSCNLHQLGLCTHSTDDDFECPVYEKAVY